MLTYENDTCSVRNTKSVLKFTSQSYVISTTHNLQAPLQVDLSRCPCAPEQVTNTALRLVGKATWFLKRIDLGLLTPQRLMKLILPYRDLSVTRSQLVGKSSENNANSAPSKPVLSTVATTLYTLKHERRGGGGKNNTSR